MSTTLVNIPHGKENTERRIIPPTKPSPTPSSLRSSQVPLSFLCASLEVLLRWMLDLRERYERVWYEVTRLIRKRARPTYATGEVGREELVAQWRALSLPGRGPQQSILAACLVDVFPCLIPMGSDPPALPPHSFHRFLQSFHHLHCPLRLSFQSSQASTFIRLQPRR